MSLSAFFDGLARGAGVALVLLTATIALQVVEAWRFARERGPLGALASVGRGWLHARRDSDVGAAALAAITGVALPCLALTFLFGPAGLLAFVTLRFTLSRKLLPHEATA